MQEKIRAELKESIEIKNQVLKSLVPKIEQAAKLMIAALRSGNKILFFGNGGSAADAQHLAGELIGRFLKERKSLPAIALTTDTSIITSVANDYGFEQIFSKQIEGLAKAGDIAFGISTSGNSKNVLRGLEKAIEKKCKAIALLGGDGGSIKKKADLSIIVPAKSTPHIQESHITIGHILCSLIEQAFDPAQAKELFPK